MVFFILGCILWLHINFVFLIAASASAFSDDDEPNYGQASIAG